MKTLKRKTLAALLALSLLASLLPLGAQPALAVDTAPQTLYVGSTTIGTGYWTSSDDGRTWTNTQQSDPPSGDSYIHYDGQGTLELHNVTIQGGTSTGSAPYDAGIYAQCNSGESVFLTIELIGENTITGYYGIYVNAEISADSNGTNATLTITSENNGSLEVSGSNHGIFVKSGTGNASLNIKNVAVTSSTNGNYAAGVYVMSGASATDSPNISLSVDGGSLTASGTGSNDGILFYVGQSQATGATTSLTVSENAIVDARNGGIKALKILETLPTPTPTGNNSSGIVFDGKNGTVYGTVELQNDLTIGAGETLTVPSGSSLNCNGKLTNDGTVTIENGGTLTDADKVTNNGTINVKDGGSITGEPTGGSGTVVKAPTITTQPENQTVTVGQTASFTVTATGENLSYQWQQRTNSGSDWTNISENATSSTYTISNTTTDMSGYQYRCVVSNSAGSVTSSAATLTVTQPVTGVTLDKNTLELFTGNTATLTATVQPDNVSNKNVTWSSNNANVATVQDGTVTAVGAGEATITVTTADGNYTATCTVKVTDPVYGMTTDTTALNFGSAYTGYAQPAAQTVTVKNTGNQQVTVTLPTSTNYIITAGTNFDNGTAILAPNDTATFTVQPKAGLSAGTYNETIEVTGTEGAAVTIPASFTVKSRPSYNPPTVSEETTEAIADAQPGETVTVDLSHGSTKLDKEVFETLAGKDITLVVDLGDGVSWTVNGSDIPEDADFTDIDLNVTMNSDGIPVNVVNAITGEVGTVQITLAHNGDFGFTMTLTAPLGKENAGYWANLYHFNEEASTMTFETAAPIGDDGSVSLSLSHASQYAIVIDDHNHGVVTLPFTDVSDSDWFYDPVCFVYSQGLMTGTSENTFEPNTPLSRAMLVAVLHRLEGSPAASAGDFTDVADGDWYAQAVNWAASVGVVNGFDDGTFQPNTAITREQLAAILMNYAQYKGQDVSARATLDTYNDATAISSWANDVMSWAVAEGLLTGVTNDQLQPQGNATRAQVAAILERFLAG